MDFIDVLGILIIYEIQDDVSLVAIYFKVS